jgi:hypothetical protein
LNLVRRPQAVVQLTTSNWWSPFGAF